MKLTTRITLGIAGGIVAIATLAGCTASNSAADTKPAPAATAKAAPVKSAVPAKTQAPAPKKTAAPVKTDPRALAQTASGLSPALYAKVSTDATALVRKADATRETMQEFETQLAPIQTEAGKPVVIVHEAPCYDAPGKSDWGYSGAIFGHGAACGEDWAGSENATIAHVIEMASSDIATSNGYVLVLAN